MYIFLKSWGVTDNGKRDLSSWHTDTPCDDDTGFSQRARYETEDEFMAQFASLPFTTQVIDLRGLGEDHLLMRYASENELSTAQKMATWADETLSGYRKRAAYEAILRSDIDKESVYLALDTQCISDRNKPVCKQEVHKVSSVEEVKNIIETYKQVNNLKATQFFGGYLFKAGVMVAETNYLGVCMVKENGVVRYTDSLPV